MSKKRKILIIVSSVLVLVLVFGSNCVFNPPIEEDFNSKYKLNVISPYGDDEAYHPKVLTFKEPWNGYKYWMSYTPYPKGDDAKENPCIASSNDLITWDVPSGFTNPLDTPADTRPQIRYNSDSHIVYNYGLDRIECYWRYVDDVEDEAILYRRCTTDGIHWTEREVAALAKERQEKHDYVSPAIIFEDGAYKMWYVNKHNTLTYETSKDGLSWGNRKVLKLKYEDKVKTWHLDVIHTQKGYEMITVAYENWKLHNNMNLYYTFSEDGINWSTAKTIVTPTTGTDHWDNRGIYRSSFVYVDGIYYVYYSGTSKDLHHGIGLMYGKDIFNLKRVKTNYKDPKSVEKLKKEIKIEQQARTLLFELQVA